MTPNKVASQLADSIPKEYQEAFARVVQAGMKVMFSEQTHSLMVEQLQAEGDISRNIGKGIASLMGLLFEKSNGTMPQEVMIPAGIYLIAKGSEFIEQITGEEVTPDIISEATDVFIETLLGSAGVDPQKFRQAFEEGAAEAEGGQPKGLLASAEKEPGEEAPGQPEEPGEAAEGETPEQEDQEEEAE